MVAYLLVWQCQNKFSRAAKGLTLASVNEKSVPILQQFPRGHPLGGDVVHPVSAVATASRGSPVRAWRRHLPRDGAFLVEPVRSDVRGRDQEAAGSSSVVFAMAMAPGRGIRADQRRDALSVARRRSRRRGARSLRHKAPGSQGCSEVPEACNEALRPARSNRDGPAPFVRCRDERDWGRGSSALRSVAQQSS